MYIVESTDGVNLMISCTHKSCEVHIPIGCLATVVVPSKTELSEGGGEGGGGGGGDVGGGQGSHEYELVGVSPGTGPPVAKAADKTYEMPSPPSHQPLPTIPLSVAPPTGGDVGVAKEGEEEGVYDNIPGDQ